MFKPGPLEIGLIVFIVLVLFGAGKLPQVGSALGKGIRAFRKGQSGQDEVVEEEDEEEEVPVRQTTRKTTTRKKTATRKRAS